MSPMILSMAITCQLGSPTDSAPTIPFAGSNCAVVATLFAARLHRKDVTFSDVNDAFAPEWRASGQLVPASAIVSALDKLGIPSEVSHFTPSEGIRQVPKGSILHCNIETQDGNKRPHYILYVDNEEAKSQIIDPDYLTNKIAVEHSVVEGKWSGYAIVMYPPGRHFRVLWWVLGIQIGILAVAIHYWNRVKGSRVPALLLLAVVVFVSPGCSQKPGQRPQSLPPLDPLSSIDLGVIQWDQTNTDRVIDTRVPWTTKKTVKEIDSNCNCTVPQRDLVGAVIDPSAPLKLPYKLRLANREGFVRSMISLKFTDGSTMVYNLRGFLEGPVRLSSPVIHAMLDPSREDSRSGEIVVERLRHTTSPPLAPRATRVEKDWASLELVGTDSVSVPADDTQPGTKYDGVVDRTRWRWQVRASKEAPGADGELELMLDWGVPSIPPKEVKFQRKLTGPLWCPVNRVVLRQTMNGKEVAGTIPLRSSLNDLAGISAVLNSSEVKSSVQFVSPGCWNLAVTLPASSLPSDGVLKINCGPHSVTVRIATSTL